MNDKALYLESTEYFTDTYIKPFPWTKKYMKGFFFGSQIDYDFKIEGTKSNKNFSWTPYLEEVSYIVRWEQFWELIWVLSLYFPYSSILSTAPLISLNLRETHSSFLSLSTSSFCNSVSFFFLSLSCSLLWKCIINFIHNEFYNEYV